MIILLNMIIWIWVHFRFYYYLGTPKLTYIIKKEVKAFLDTASDSDF